MERGDIKLGQHHSANLHHIARSLVVPHLPPQRPIPRLPSAAEQSHEWAADVRSRIQLITYGLPECVELRRGFKGGGRRCAVAGAAEVIRVQGGGLESDARNECGPAVTVVDAVKSSR